MARKNPAYRGCLLMRNSHEVMQAFLGRILQAFVTVLSDGAYLVWMHCFEARHAKNEQDLCISLVNALFWKCFWGVCTMHVQALACGDCDVCII